MANPDLAVRPLLGAVAPEGGPGIPVAGPQPRANARSRADIFAAFGSHLIVRLVLALGFLLI